jgi:hypothetical protein
MSQQQERDLTSDCVVCDVQTAQELHIANARVRALQEVCAAYELERDGANELLILLGLMPERCRTEEGALRMDLVRDSARTRQESVAYQQLVDGKWIECSYFVAFGWGKEISPNCRALYTHPTPTTARYEYIRARYLSDDMEAPFLPDGATYANTPEEFDAAIDAAIDYEAGKEADEDRYEDPSAIFGDPRA